MKDVIKDLQVISIGNKSYLGVIQDNKINHAIEYEGESRRGYAIRHWFERFNINELSVISINKNSGYTIRPLDREEQLKVDRCTVLMGRIKRFSMQYLENDLFDRFYKDEGK